MQSDMCYDKQLGLDSDLHYILAWHLSFLPRQSSSFPGFKKTVGRFRGINSDFFMYKFFRCRDPLGALKRPFFCLPTHFIPLADPFYSTF
jgi:hypothetical protein